MIESFPEKVDTSSQEVLSNTRENISQLFKNKEYFDLIRSFPEKDRSKLIGDTIEYSQLFDSDIESVKKYILEKKESDKSIIIVEHIASKLNIDINDINRDEKIFDYFNKKFINDGYYYHGFNGVFEESIEKNGLNTTERIWDEGELNKIHKIFSRAGNTMILGWRYVNSDDNKFFLSGSPEQTYRYANVSPEWFAQFISEGSHIPINNENYDKKAFQKRDYFAARKNVEMLCERLMSRDENDINEGKSYPNITEAEKNCIINFFEKYWKLLISQESSVPKAALVPKNKINKSKPLFTSFLDYKEWKLENRTILSSNDIVNIESYIKLIIDIDESNKDARFTENIEYKDLRIIDLPDYNEIMKN